MSRQDEWTRETEAAALERLRSAANAHHELSQLVPSGEMHVALRNRLRAAGRPTASPTRTAAAVQRLAAQLDRARRLFEYGEYDWETFCKRRDELMSRSISLRTRLRQARSTSSGANPSCSTSRPYGRRLTQASGNASSQASSSTSKPRLCQRVRCAWSPFLASRGDRFSKAWYWSGRRASNPLPRPWQGRALPSELLPLGQRIDFTRLAGTR